MCGKGREAEVRQEAAEDSQGLCREGRPGAACGAGDGGGRAAVRRREGGRWESSGAGAWGAACGDSRREGAG